MVTAPMSSLVAHRLLGCVKKAVVNSLREVLLSLYSPLVRPLLCPCWAPHIKRDKELLESVGGCEGARGMGISDGEELVET